MTQYPKRVLSLGAGVQSTAVVVDDDSRRDT
jgi:hypothetical protein